MYFLSKTSVFAKRRNFVASKKVVRLDVLSIFPNVRVSRNYVIAFVSFSRFSFAMKHGWQYLLRHRVGMNERRRPGSTWLRVTLLIRSA